MSTVRNAMKTLLALMLAAFFATGCNTVEGFGKDVQKVGEKVEHAAKK
jgi:entericidin A